jgi:hypothetical protein
MAVNGGTTASTVFITAADARQNPIRERVIFDESTEISSAILEAVRTGYYSALINGGTVMTQNQGVSEQVSSINDVTSTFTVLNHPWNHGDAVFVNSTGALPSPLKLATLYYVIFVDADNIRLAVSKPAALAARPINIMLSNGLNSITLTNPGNGYTSTPAVTVSGGNAAVAGTAQAVLAAYGSVNYIVVGSHGSGYHYPPSVEISSQGSGAAAGLASFVAVTALVNQRGINYTQGATLTVLGGSGSATQCTITGIDSNGSVLAVAISRPGLYATLPSLGNVATSVSPGGGNGCTLDLSMGIGSIALANGGGQYTAPPLVAISGGGGTGAQAYVSLSAGSVNTIGMSAAGMGYMAQPTIAITSGGGATAVAYLQPTAVGTIGLLNNGGLVYTTPPAVSITASGSGATVGTVHMSILTATLTTGGAGSQYVVGDILTVSGGTGSASATLVVNVVDGAGSIVNWTLLTGGLYTVLPAMQGNAAFGGRGQAAAFNLTAGLNAVQLTSGGSGYTAAPTVIVTPPDGIGVGATAYALLDGSSVSNVVVTSPGMGYDQTPVITLTSGSGATAVSNLTATSVQFVNVSNSGSGYTTASVVFVSEYGFGAEATAVISGGSINNIVVTAGGHGYVQPPAVTIYGDGQGAEANTQLTATSVASLTLTNLGSNYTSIPTVAIDGAATGNVNLYSTGIQQIVVTNAGADYSSAPQVNVIAGAGESTVPTQPSTNVLIGRSLAAVNITSQGQGYTSAPTINISAPQLASGNAATATAGIGYGSGTMIVLGYPASYDYFQVWQGGNALDPNQTRPYADQMGTILNYFTNLGYTIQQQTNPNTNRTFQWNVKW